jgi:quercetin dioxygenase-like cupin family protein
MSKTFQSKKDMSARERNLVKLFPTLQEYCSPKVIGEVNDVYVKITKVVGNDVPWHTHDREDEMFYMVKGSLQMELRGKPGFTLAEGEYFIVPQGIEHRVSSERECWILLIEPKRTEPSHYVGLYVRLSYSATT